MELTVCATNRYRELGGEVIKSDCAAKNALSEVFSTNCRKYASLHSSAKLIRHRLAIDRQARHVDPVASSRPQKGILAPTFYSSGIGKHQAD